MRRRDRGLFLAVTVSWLASEVVARALGVRFDASTFTYFWQLLDSEVLRTDLLRAVFYLHAQPPLFNLFVGSVLKLPPEAASIAFTVVYAAMSLGLLLAMAWLLRRNGVPRIVAALACAAFAFHPSFMVYTHWLFYTVPVAVLVALAAVALERHVETGRAVYAHAFAWLAATVMLTRAVYHPLWLVAVLVVVGRIVDRTRFRQLLAASVVPLVVVNLWYAKNLWEIGSYQASSWVGMNLANGWRLPPGDVDALVAARALPAVWRRGPFLGPDAYTDVGYFGPAAVDAGPHHATLDAPYKWDGYPNYNHRDYARISRALLGGAVTLVETHPGAFLARVRRAVRLFATPGPRLLLVTYDATDVRRLTEWCARPVSPRLVAAVILGLLGWGAGVSSGRGPRARRVVVAYAVVTVLWVGVCTSLVEVGENDRMRWEIDPLLVVLLGGAITAIASRLAASARNGKGALHDALADARPAAGDRYPGPRRG